MSDLSIQYRVDVYMKTAGQWWPVVGRLASVEAARAKIAYERATYGSEENAYRIVKRTETVVE